MVETLSVNGLKNDFNTNFAEKTTQNIGFRYTPPTLPNMPLFIKMKRPETSCNKPEQARTSYNNLVRLEKTQKQFKRWNQAKCFIVVAWHSERG